MDKKLIQQMKKLSKYNDPQYWINWCRQLVRVCQLLIDKNKTLTGEINKYKHKK